ncbi:glycoside hydrolase family 3 protein [Plectosphaerella plurivora]|uniref:Beta-glucosidase cel3A n=1 Tax=Plectosphaerella plurivora TaxID=936078 RepID=A0A9P9A1W7_9PEZI|nr:glycoside hydrolase family 3 protein [Plectosphaerella plurivora]
MTTKAIAGVFAIVAALNGALAGDLIEDDSFFSGHSPPFYPSPRLHVCGKNGSHISRARDLVGQMTLEEKVGLTGGIAPPEGVGCTGFIAAIPRLNFPGLCLKDAGQGVRGSDLVNAYPAGIHVGASWNRELAAKRAHAMAGEFRRKGVNVMLGPSIGPLGRIVTGGRIWEGFSADPYLTGVLAYETVTEAQAQGVMTSTKHFIGNEQETNRMPYPGIAAISSNIDDVAMHELYMWPFQDAIRAGSTNIMCSYQRLNNSYGCQNSKALNGLLKTELGFEGFVVTDWDAQHSGVGSALAGLDMTMPSGDEFWGEHLVEAVKNGSVPEARLDDMVTRIVAAWYELGQDKADFPQPGFGLPEQVWLPHEQVEARDPGDKPILYDGALEGHVLVKNEGGFLPLKSPKIISLLGYSAKAPDKNVATNETYPAWSFGFQSADMNEFVSKLNATFSGERQELSQIAFGGTILSGGGSGSSPMSAFMSPFAALQARAVADSTQLFWDFDSGEPDVNAASDACLVFGNAFATEIYDRAGLRDEYTDTLISSVAAACENTVVILHNAGARLVDAWIEHPNVKAVIFAHLPGQETGNALVSLLYGDENFSGKLPYTVAKNESDYGGLYFPDEPEGSFRVFPQSNFSEGVYIDYRHFDALDIEPRYEFGFGLGYSTFEYSSLRMDGPEGEVPAFPSGKVLPGGQVDLWDAMATVTAEVTNTGTVDGAEVAQLYLGIPGGPAKQLRGFEKKTIKTGETATFTFLLSRRDLSVWDVEAQKWRLPGVEYALYVGSSSRKISLETSLVITVT